MAAENAEEEATGARAARDGAVDGAGPHIRSCVDASCLWDPHSCLNALNRCIINSPESLAEDHPLYLLSDHLRLLAQLCHSGGWVSPAGLREWLSALMALQPAVKTSGGNTARHTVAPVPGKVLKLQIQPLGMALMPLLQQAGPGACVAIEAGDACVQGGQGVQSVQGLPGLMNKAGTLLLRLRVSEGRQARASSLSCSDGAVPALREWDVQVVCECVLAH